MKKPDKYHFSADYRIKLKGHLDHKWSDWFDGMTISSQDRETILTGQVADQAALHGLLIRIRDLNMILLQLERIDPDQDDKQ